MPRAVVPPSPSHPSPLVKCASKRGRPLSGGSSDIRVREACELARQPDVSRETGARTLAVRPLERPAAGVRGMQARMLYTPPAPPSPPRETAPPWPRPRSSVRKRAGRGGVDAQLAAEKRWMRSGPSGCVRSDGATDPAPVCPLPRHQIPPWLQRRSIEQRVLPHAQRFCGGVLRSAVTNRAACATARDDALSRAVGSTSPSGECGTAYSRSESRTGGSVSRETSTSAPGGTAPVIAASPAEQGMCGLGRDREPRP